MAKRYVIRDGKIYARITYFDSTGKERQLWRRAESRSEAKELARDVAHSIKQFGAEAFEHHLTASEYLDKWLKSLRLSERAYSCMRPCYAFMCARSWAGRKSRVFVLWTYRN